MTNYQKTPFAEIYVMAALPGVDVHVMAEEQFINAFQDGYFNSNKSNILVLFKSIHNVRQLRNIYWMVDYVEC